VESSKFSELLYERIEYWGERILDAVTPAILLFEGMEKTRIHYQFFLVVAGLTLFALMVIFFVDRQVIKRQQKELLKLSSRFRPDGHLGWAITSNESALETLASRRERWQKETAQARNKVHGSGSVNRNMHPRQRAEGPSTAMTRPTKPLPTGVDAIEDEHLPTFFRS